MAKKIKKGDGFIEPENIEHTTIISERLEAIVTIPKEVRQNKQEIHIDPKETRQGKIAAWGSNNLFPQDVIKDCQKSTIIPSTLDRMARWLYSGGIVWGTVENGANGIEIFTPKKDDTIRDFMRRVNINRYLIEAAKNFYWFWNTFPTLIVSNDRKTIANLDIQPSWQCRYEWQNEDTGIIENVYLHADWANETLEGENATKIPALDPDFDVVTQLKRTRTGKQFILPVSYPSVGQVYYQLADWDAARSSGWLAFSLAIPQFKKSLMENQISLKYHIEIAEDWWKWKYPDWEKMKPEDKIAKMKLEVDNFNKFLKGSENAGKTFMTSFRRDPITLKEFPGWKITPIDDKIKDGIYVEDSQESSSQILYSMSIDPTLVGNGPGKNMGSGSGSDKRVAFNMHIQSVKAHQDLILRPLEIIRDYNGWDADIEFRFRNYVIATLDEGKEMKPAE